MPAPRLFAAVGELSPYLPLLRLAAAAGHRIGWLELDAAPVVDPALDDAVAAGAFRAVKVGAGRQVAVRAAASEPVLRDLLRVHFQGCAAVLVLGAEGLPRLAPAAGEWELDRVDGGRRRLDSAALLRHLGRRGEDRRSDLSSPRSSR
ncbi:MAG: hypothetical protein R3190_07925 [Thermoanaerobaculia bacterium]|nr:hypothetical protein [Thermoanaerobaculia bacterium]